MYPAGCCEQGTICPFIFLWLRFPSVKPVMEETVRGNADAQDTHGEFHACAPEPRRHKSVDMVGIVGILEPVDVYHRIFLAPLDNHRDLWRL